MAGGNDYKIKPDWRFKKAYKESGLTIKQLSGMCGIHPTYLSMYAVGRYRLDSLERRRIAKALRMDVDEVFSN